MLLSLVSRPDRSIRICPLHSHFRSIRIQSEKDLLERETAALRQSLRELRQAGREHTLSAHVWQAEFARQHEKLVIVASKDRRA